MIDLVTEDTRWDALDLAALAGRAVEATLRRADIDPDLAEVAILACDDARIAALNASFRAEPGATNVLSWPAEDLSPAMAGDVPRAPSPGRDGLVELGDVAIAWDTCAREAADQGKELAAHVTHLIVHATLHLLGFDHVRNADATRMEALEVEILGSIGLPNPY